LRNALDAPGDILDEYKEVSKRLRMRSTLVGAVINLIRERAEPANVHESFKISPDPKDDLFCPCSEEGNADFMVTLNPKDFPREGLRPKVISPEAMA
jgi:predicted nucleic acid-binding protein